MQNSSAADGTKRGHAIALFSGGLDSTLAILLVLRQNIRVTALTFQTHFGCGGADSSSRGTNPYVAAERFGFDVKMMHLGDKFIEIVKSPRYGYGKNLNPCIDCRILMLREARLFMEIAGADFVITGEVLGQRPKSQMRGSLNTVRRESGLGDLLVRPLSARLLPETIPEKEGLLDRNLLEGISGRSRKRQMELANKFGLDDYPAPAGGCLLTDPNYTKRLRDLLSHSAQLTFDELDLLRIGRHFRLDERTKFIVGRHESDNEEICRLVRPEYLMMEALGTGSPVGLLIGDLNDDNIRSAAAITARYSDLKDRPEVEITILNRDGQPKIKMPPAAQSEINKYQIK